MAGLIIKGLLPKYPPRMTTVGEGDVPKPKSSRERRALKKGR